MDKYKILIAEDDEDIVELLKLYIEKENLEVIAASDGETALSIIKNQHVDLVVLDIMLPKANGYEVTKRIRANYNIPILIVSAKNLDSDKILGLDLGADDYLTKPFNPLEVVARIKSMLRRCYNLNDIEDSKRENKTKIITLGELEMDLELFMVTKHGKQILLTPTEYKILALFMKSPGRVYTKTQIYEVIHGEYFMNDENALMVHISRLREKIEDDPKNPKYIKTIRGVGYKIEKEEKIICK
ncbi:MAG: response regulator transcription factor [Epulopiscium sp.]|nr:response regulator transcription factor [Candidatus Epulonipiscium sp.]